MALKEGVFLEAFAGIGWDLELKVEAEGGGIHTVYGMHSTSISRTDGASRHEIRETVNLGLSVGRA